MEKYRKQFSGEPDAVAAIDKALSRIDEVIEDLRSESQPEPDDDYYDRGTPAPQQSNSRSIFDDVDD